MTTTNATADERQAFRVWLGGITEDAFQGLLAEARQGGFRHGPDWLYRHYRDNVALPAPVSGGSPAADDAEPYYPDPADSAWWAEHSNQPAESGPAAPTHLARYVFDAATAERIAGGNLP